jgi:hypothetical protein
MVHYRTFSTEVYSQYIGLYMGYGIESVNPDGTVASRIEDISEDGKYVQIITNLLNENGAEAVHFRDIVEDLMN